MVDSQGSYSMKPEEMEKAIIRNLADKTGRSLEEWFGVLRDTDLSEKRELKEHLIANDIQVRDL